MSETQTDVLTGTPQISPKDMTPEQRIAYKKQKAREAAERVKAKKEARPNHPLKGNTDKTVYPFKEMPTDFNHDDMLPLESDDFLTSAGYYRYRAHFFEFKAARLRQMATNAELGGPAGDTGKALKTAAAAMKRIEDIKRLLAAQGIDLVKALKDEEEKLRAGTAAPAAE